MPWVCSGHSRYAFSSHSGKQPNSGDNRISSRIRPCSFVAVARGGRYRLSLLDHGFLELHTAPESTPFGLTGPAEETRKTGQMVQSREHVLQDERYLLFGAEPCLVTTFSIFNRLRWRSSTQFFNLLQAEVAGCMHNAPCFQPRLHLSQLVVRLSKKTASVQSTFQDLPCALALQLERRLLRSSSKNIGDIRLTVEHTATGIFMH